MRWLIFSTYGKWNRTCRYLLNHVNGNVLKNSGLVLILTDPLAVKCKNQPYHQFIGAVPKELKLKKSEKFLQLLWVTWQQYCGVGYSLDRLLILWSKQFIYR